MPGDHAALDRYPHLSNYDTKGANGCLGLSEDKMAMISADRRGNIVLDSQVGEVDVGREYGRSISHDVSR